MLIPWCFRVFAADECGIVAQISEPLATADIPAYYISTFKFDHALVRRKPEPSRIITLHFPTLQYQRSNKLSLLTFLTLRCFNFERDKEFPFCLEAG